MEPIAVIKLMPGQVGYYDEYSHVHLTLGSPTALIYPGTNCTQLRRSLKAGRISLVSGTLGEDIPPFKLVKRGEKHYLASNEEYMKPFNPEPIKKAEAPSAKEEVAPEPEKEEETVISPEGGEEEKEQLTQDEVPDDVTVEEDSSEEETTEEEVKKPARKTTRKKPASKK